jgi:cellulose synthase operon protein C
MVTEETYPVLPQPDADKLSALQSLYDDGRYLDAWHAVQGLAPLEQWSSTPALVLGGRLASHWGDTALSNRLHMRAHRQSPGDDTAYYFYILTIHAKHGAFEALRLLGERTSSFSDTAATLAQADLWIQQARLLAIFRDFDAAEACLSVAERAFPDHPWLWNEKSSFLREQDRYEEALAAAQEATRRQPWYRPAIQSQVHLLQLLGRDDEAIALLEAAQSRLQSAAIVQTHVLALEEKGRHAELLTLLDRLATLEPLASAGNLRWIAARRCDAALRLGDEATALTAAREAGPGYYEDIVKRLETPATPDDRRVLLPVGFVRQHHMTCAPATMAALGRYFGRPIDHLELARAICYDGTPAHMERAWAEEHGWTVREFRVTWDSARALLDRGCAFALVTVGIRSGHMQAVIGYDSRLGTLLIRDPYQRSYSEWNAGALFKDHVSSGPRGMIMIPPEKAAELAGVDLPDETSHARYHDLQLALARHNRPAAETALAALESVDTDHLLTHKARHQLAYYDANPARALTPVRRLRELFPDDVNVQLDELQLLEQLGKTAEHRELLRTLAGRRRAPLVFQLQETEELIRDSRNHPRAFKRLRRALRRHSSDPRTLIALANLLWGSGRHAEATCVYRLAASSADKVESNWDSYFKASRHIRETDESLALIRHRFEQWGDRSGQPARTLFDCLEALDRSPEAFDVLAAALAKRPADGDLILFAAEAHGRYTRPAEAAALMRAAEPITSAAAWRRTAANLANYQGDHALSLNHWREIVALNPADTHAHGSVARLLAIVEGRAAAIRHLEEACARQPNLLPLRQSHIQWLRDESVERILESIESLLTLDPLNAWAHREKALALLRLQRPDQALAAAEEALRISPLAPASHGIRAEVFKSIGNLAQAREGYRAGIRLSIDADWLFSDLISACPDFPTRREAVLFIRDELLRQTSLDNACLQFRSAARSILKPDELRIALETLWRRHPESWSAWSVLIAHLLDQDLLAEALARASDAATRFPLTPRIWLDLAGVHSRLDDTDAARVACEKALAISPAWSVASRHLSKIHERTLHLELAAQVLRRAIALDPNDAYNHGWLADVLWRQRNPQAALASVEKALSLNPDYSWAWDRLDEWGAIAGAAGRALQLAETFTQTRSGEADCWLRLVRLRFNDSSLEANLEALDRAITLAPRNVDIYDLRAELLATHKRYDEAAEACRPSCFEPAVPLALQGRAAWIEHRRGRLAQAIDRMLAVTDAHPDYLWGWSLLTQWFWADNQFERVKNAAERWAWLDPHASLPHGYIAIVHRQDGRRREAKESLSRSLVASPVYEFGAFELLRLQLADSEFDMARQTLRHIETHFSAAESLRATVIYHITSKDRNAAQQDLHALGSLPGVTTDDLQNSVDLVLEAGWDRQVEASFAPLLSDAKTPPELGRHWGRARAKKSLVLTLWSLHRRRPTPAHRTHFDSLIVESLGEKNRILTLRAFCLLRRRALRSNLETWAQVGYAFNTANRFRSVVRWMHDWRDRPDAKPWMRFNLIQSLYSCKRPAEARAVLVSTLSMPPDHTHDKLLVWEAIEYALDGEHAVATATLGRINISRLPDYYQALLTFIECMLAVQKAPADLRASALVDAKSKLAEKCASFPAILSGHALTQFYRRTLRRLGQDGRSPWLRIRSRLPLFKPGTATTATDVKIPPGMIWVAILVLSGLLRTCSTLSH